MSELVPKRLQAWVLRAAGLFALVGLIIPGAMGEPLVDGSPVPPSSSSIIVMVGLCWEDGSTGPFDEGPGGTPFLGAELVGALEALEVGERRCEGSLAEVHPLPPGSVAPADAAVWSRGRSRVSKYGEQP